MKTLLLSLLLAIGIIALGQSTSYLPQGGGSLWQEEQAEVVKQQNDTAIVLIACDNRSGPLKTTNEEEFFDVLYRSVIKGEYRVAYWNEVTIIEIYPMQMETGGDFIYNLIIHNALKTNGSITWNGSITTLTVVPPKEREDFECFIKKQLDTGYYGTCK